MRARDRKKDKERKNNTAEQVGGVVQNKYGRTISKWGDEKMCEASTGEEEEESNFYRNLWATGEGRGVARWIDLTVIES